MKTILSYPNRGHWGNASWRGNCSGHIIKDLLEFYKPKKFVEVFSGGNTGKDVCNELGIKNSVHLDLVTGWNALVSEIPCAADLVFSHPPFFDLRNFENMTWRDLIQGALEYLGAQAELNQIYETIKHCKKAKKNPHWKEKIRQTLQIHDNFEPIERGKWKLKIA